jgi:hypothetical protein
VSLDLFALNGGRYVLKQGGIKCKYGMIFTHLDCLLVTVGGHPRKYRALAKLPNAMRGRDFVELRPSEFLAAAAILQARRPDGRKGAKRRPREVPANRDGRGRFC